MFSIRTLFFSFLAISCQMTMACHPLFGQAPDNIETPEQVLKRNVDSQNIAGAVGLVIQHGQVKYFDAYGNIRPDKKAEKDSLFRIASMTKPITSAAIMILVDEGKVRLGDSLTKYLPEFEKTMVRDLIDGKEAPPRRSVTIRDLLTHTSGISYGLNPPKFLFDEVTKANLADGLNSNNIPLEENIKKVAAIPFAHQPGTLWTYGMNTDVLGRVIEVASGQTLEQFFVGRIFTPLKMNDTFFNVPESKRDRLASLYRPGADKKASVVGAGEQKEGIIRYNPDRVFEQKYFSGGAGLVSSAGDYGRFLQMLLNGGELEGVRILKRESVQKMTMNQIGQQECAYKIHGDKFGFGFGITTPASQTNGYPAVGSYSWGGMYHTFFWVDPENQLAAVVMTQLFPFGNSKLWPDFQKSVYNTIPKKEKKEIKPANVQHDSKGRFYREFWYEHGPENGNINSVKKMKFRVNDPQTGLHHDYGKRTETKGNGMMQIRIDEPLSDIIDAELALEIWGGHPGTVRKRVSVNGRSTYSFPEIGTAAGHCTHQYPVFKLERTDLVHELNALQFNCDKGDTFWGHFIVENACIRLEVPATNAKIKVANLSQFSAKCKVSPGEGESISLTLDVPQELADKILSVDYQAYYKGFDENGDGKELDWHGMIKQKKPLDWAGSSAKAPFAVNFNTAMILNQPEIAIRANVLFKDDATLAYTTPVLTGVQLPSAKGEVLAFKAKELPRPFWSRDNKLKSCEFDCNVDPAEIEKAELRLVIWDGGTEEIKQPFKLNGQALPFESDKKHDVKSLSIPINPAVLKQGKNTLDLLSDTLHHGIEVCVPGPQIWIRKKAVNKVSRVGDGQYFDPGLSAKPFQSLNINPGLSAKPFQSLNINPGLSAKPFQSLNINPGLNSVSMLKTNDKEAESEIDRYRQLVMNKKGDAKKGKEIYLNEQKSKCVTCHKNGTTGGEVGPELTLIGGKFDKNNLMTAILEPSFEIVEGFRTTTLNLADGRTINGIVKSENQQTVSIVDADGKIQIIKLSDIDQRKISSVSLMPADLQKNLSAEEFNDLIAYLETLHNGKKPSPGEGITGSLTLPAGFKAEAVAGGLTGCTALEVLPDGRVLVCEQTGTLRMVKDGRLLPEPVLKVSIDPTWERGLIGVTIDPKFSENSLIYINYVSPTPYVHHVISCWKLNGDIADPKTETILLEGDDQSKMGGNVPAGHQGGALHFGADGKLYIAIGEQTAGIPSQNLDTLLGKILRINSDGTIPEDNPFYSTSKGKYRAIYSYGLRNPYCFAIQDKTGLIYANDVGGKAEEVNEIKAGLNFGWPKIDHGPTSEPGIQGPVHSYATASITGAAFATNDLNWPCEFQKKFYFTDFVHGWVKYFDPANPKEVKTFATGLRRPVDMRFAKDQSFYVLVRDAWVYNKEFKPKTGSLIRIYQTK